ncbi:hypothetical protein SAMN06269250_3710 [Spirosoma fluviale]|uniref:Uncharacterized protein n=1 Tax=Spirosoma fluviale TaxID=1597977 RepID=A0A286G8M8_9BACT|nr:hypothetical protein SAMN06269250_3710 [Spirosoma fluviale]
MIFRINHDFAFRESCSLKIIVSHKNHMNPGSDYFFTKGGLTIWAFSSRSRTLTKISVPGLLNAV